MKRTNFPYATVIICTATLLCSIGVAFAVTGRFMGSVRIVQLEPYGGITFAHLGNLELWRLFASQLIHVKQMHMLYNVLSLALLGFVLERHAGAFKFFLLWLMAGAAGTLVGTLFVTPPWNLGTGASQAVLGIAAFGLALFLKGAVQSKSLVVVLCFSLVPAFALDFIYAGYPKPGHIVPLLIGGIAGVMHCRQASKVGQHASPSMGGV
jgi:rhomboid protease GluP